MIDVSKLKKGDQYYNQKEGWVVVDHVEFEDPLFKIWTSASYGYIRVTQNGSDPQGDDEWSITEVKIADENQPAQDMVNSPSHYQLVDGLEVKDIRKAIFDKIPMGKLSYHQADCYSRAWEYLTRACFKHESPLEDLQKAQTYLTWLIEDLSLSDKPLSNTKPIDKSDIHGSLATPTQNGEI